MGGGSYSTLGQLAPAWVTDGRKLFVVLFWTEKKTRIASSDSSSESASDSCKKRKKKAVVSRARPQLPRPPTPGLQWCRMQDQLLSYRHLQCQWCSVPDQLHWCSMQDQLRSHRHLHQHQHLDLRHVRWLFQKRFIQLLRYCVAVSIFTSSFFTVNFVIVFMFFRVFFPLSFVHVVSTLFQFLLTISLFLRFHLLVTAMLCCALFSVIHSVSF